MLGFKWTTAFDLRIVFYMFQSCYTDWERVHMGWPSSKLVRHGILRCLWTSWVDPVLTPLLHITISSEHIVGWRQMLFTKKVIFRSSAVKVPWIPSRWKREVENEWSPNNNEWLRQQLHCLGRQNDCLTLIILVSGTYRTSPFFTLTNPAKSEVCLEEQWSSTVTP